ncbi:unnamed protein product, partial [Polarella glacialis]
RSKVAGPRRLSPVGASGSPEALNETDLAAQMSQAMYSGDRMDVPSLHELPPEERFRLSAAMMVVQHMINPHAPKVRRSAEPPATTTKGMLASGLGPRYWADLSPRNETLHQYMYP